MTPERAIETNHWNAPCANCNHRKGAHGTRGIGHCYMRDKKPDPVTHTRAACPCTGFIPAK